MSIHLAAHFMQQTDTHTGDDYVEMLQLLIHCTPFSTSYAWYFLDSCYHNIMQNSANNNSLLLNSES